MCLVPSFRAKKCQILFRKFFLVFYSFSSNNIDDDNDDNDDGSNNELNNRVPRFIFISNKSQVFDKWTCLFFAKMSEI